MSLNIFDHTIDPFAPVSSDQGNHKIIYDHAESIGFRMPLVIVDSEYKVTNLGQSELRVT